MLLYEDIIFDGSNSAKMLYYCINCFSTGNGNNDKDAAYIQLEQEILTPLAGSGKMFALQV